MRYKLEVLLLFLITLSIRIAFYSINNVELLNSYKSKSLSLLEPAYSLQATVVENFNMLSNSYNVFFDSKDKFKELEIQNKELSLALALSKEKIYENIKLRELLNFRNKNSFETIPANITTNLSRGGEVTIDRGSSSGVHLGDSLIDGSCVVGKVVSASENFSKIQVLTHSLSSIGALIQETRLKALIEGNSTPLLELNYADPLREIKVGENVLSSGDDGFIPRGLKIGKVAKIKDNSGFRETLVEPCASITTLDSVLVLLNLSNQND